MRQVTFTVLLLLTLVACTASPVETLTERVTYTVSEITYQEDETLLVGQEKELQAALPGTKEVTREITTDRGQVVKNEIVSEKILVEAKPAIIARGIREVKRRIEIEKIPPPTEPVYLSDDTLAEGVSELVHEAQAGQLEVTYQDYYVRGTLVQSTAFRRREILAASAQTFRVGTKEDVVKTDSPVVTTPPVPVTPTTDYSSLSNADLSWWYQPGPPSSISADVASLIGAHRVYWQLPQGRSVVYLTFDEGYEYGSNTTSILDTLKAKGVKATFFVTGGYVDSNPGLVQRMKDEGHQLANHTVHHYRAASALNESDDKYIQDVTELNQKVTGMTKLHRPPEGGYSERSLTILDDLGYTAVFWSFAYRDWLTDNQPDPASAKTMILDNLHDGSILLLHAVSNTNTEILGDVIDGIWAKGYTIELLPTQ